MSFDPQLFPLGTNMRLTFVVCFQCNVSAAIRWISVAFWHPRVPRINFGVGGFFLVSICFMAEYIQNCSVLINKC